MSKTPRSFTHITTWVFDLDNTLYPHHVDLWQQVDARMGEFVGNYLKVSAEEARRISEGLLSPLRHHHARHDDRARRQRRRFSRLRARDRSFAAAAKPGDGRGDREVAGRKLILTNGSTDHADTVLQRLGIGAHFEAVFDIIAAELEPKPAPQTYQKFLRLHGVDPLTSAMFEDLARNLAVPHQLGMTTVLVVPDGTKQVVREDWELEGRDAAHVDHVTDDLTGFLQRLS